MPRRRKETSEPQPHPISLMQKFDERASPQPRHTGAPNPSQWRWFARNAVCQGWMTQQVATSCFPCREQPRLRKVAQFVFPCTKKPRTPLVCPRACCTQKSTCHRQSMLVLEVGQPQQLPLAKSNPESLGRSASTAKVAQGKSGLSMRRFLTKPQLQSQFQHMCSEPSKS